ncbi:MAG: hypothetical protein AABX89_03830 [Candidatus Thermoplasmatota archaeon]
MRNGAKVYGLRTHSRLGDEVFESHESSEHLRIRLRGYLLDLAEEFHGKVPDATTLSKGSGGQTLQDVAIRVAALVDRWYPASHFSSKAATTLLEGNVTAIPLRVLVAEHAAAVVCEEINRGDAWLASVGRRTKARQKGMYMALRGVLLRLAGVPKKFT